MVIAQATPSISWATPPAVTYGTALSATQLDASSTVAGSFSYNPTSGTVETAGTHTLTATFTPTDGTDYISATASVTLTVNQATPSIMWSTPSAIFYGTALSATQLDASSTVAGSFSYSPASGTVETAGSHTLTATFTPTDTNDYTAATATVTLTVNQATPPITWATPSAITYGMALSGTQLDASSTVLGTFSYNPAAGTIEIVGQHELTATLTPTDTTDYTTATASVTLTVNQATPPIAWATPSAITYGTPLSSTQLDAASNVAGSFSYSPTSGTIESAGSHTLTATFTPTDTTDYSSGTASVTLIVTQATPSITWPQPSAITYGTALSSAQLDATANVAGTLAYSPASGTLLSAGSRTLNVTFTPTDSADYAGTTGSATLQVNKAASSSNATASATPIYINQSETIIVAVGPSINGAAPTGSVSFSDSSTLLTTINLANGSASYTTTTLTAGAHTLNMLYSGDSNFTSSSSSVAITVNPTPPDFTFTPGSTQSETILPQGVGTFSFALSPTEGVYPSSVTFTASGLPPGMIATFSPASLPATSGAQTVTMTVEAGTTAQHTPGQLVATGLSTLALCLLLLPLRSVRRLRKSSRWFLLSLFAISFAMLTALTGCGSSTGFFGQSQQSYTITATATSGDVEHTASVSLTVE
jgi:hypothetical protein